MITRTIFRCMGDRRVEQFCQKCVRLPTAIWEEDLPFCKPEVKKQTGRKRDNIYRCVHYRSMEGIENEY